MAYQNSGWSRGDDGWWSTLGWDRVDYRGTNRKHIRLRFGDGTEDKHFSHLVNGSVLMLHDVLPYVTELRLKFGETENMIKKVFEAMNLSKQSQLKVLEANGAGLNDVESLAEAIASGGLSSLETLALTHGKIGDGHFALARAMASDGVPALESLNLCATWLRDDHCLEYEAILMNSSSVVPYLKYLILSNTALTEVGMLSLAKALRSGSLNSLKELDVTRSNSDHPSEKGANVLVSALYRNNCLTVDIKYEWHRFPDLDRRRKQLIQRNSTNVYILAGLSGSSVVPASFGKVYLCGNPEVGKTTLRRTLQRSPWRAMLTWETWPRVEPRTRGIHVSQFLSKSSQLEKNPITLRVWDMAGQEDYHLVHNAFFPALTFVQGTATTFVVVCTTTNLERSEQELDYWLRYIASSCDKTIQDNLIQNLRNVLVVLNNIGGHRTAQRYENDWKKVLKLRREKFRGYLDIQTDIFLVDVRKRRHVKGLKRRLSNYSRNLLQDQNVPAICQLIQSNLIDWSDANKQFPVLQWEGFVEKINEVSDPGPLENVIYAAAKYLNDAGILISIDQKFPREWRIPYRRLVVIDPNWFCNEIVGNIFLTEDMRIENERLFRSEVDRTTGSISISEFKRFFQSMHGKWSDSDFNDLITILLWLGLCYIGRDSKMFIPALIREHGTPGRHWSPQNLCAHEGNQWVMGFSVEHERKDIALPPISLWHRFQVEIAQTPTFNGKIDNDLVADKYFMTFNVDFMTVLIVCQNSLFKLSKNDLYNPRGGGKKQTESSTRAQQEPAPAASSAELNWGSPTFDEINIFVMPLKKKDDMDGTQRQQLQVDLASDLVEILLGLWNAVCPGVNYVHRVIWPWPVSKPGPNVEPKKYAKVTEVRQWVQEHGPGRKMQWEVGSNNWITEDQLLSKNDKRCIVDSVQDNLDVLRQGMEEAVELRIFPPDVVSDDAFWDNSTSHPDGHDAASQPLSPTRKAVSQLASNLRRVEMKVDKIGKNVEEGFMMVLNKQKELLRKLQDTEEIFLQDKDRTCPNHIYLGKKTTEGAWAWATLKEAFSATVRLHFACEVEFDNYRPHPVKNQKGLDLSELKDWVKLIMPWLKVSLTVLHISAKVAANSVLPGVGLLVPGFVDWQQGGSLSEGIEWATGFSKEEQDKLMIEGMGLDADPVNWEARDLYRKSREAMTKLIGKLTPEEYEERLGLRRVLLKSGDDSSHGIVWSCSECFEKFRQSGRSVGFVKF